MQLQGAYGCRHSGKSVADNMLFRIYIGRPPIGMMLGLFLHSPSLRLQVFVHVHVKEHMFHRVHAVKRSSPDRHTRSRQVCHGPPCSVAPGRRNVSLFGPVRCTYIHDIAVFVIFGGILAPLGCMRPSRAHRSRLRYVWLRPSLTPLHATPVRRHPVAARQRLVGHSLLWTTIFKCIHPCAFVCGYL